ncbi:FUSC family protein [Vibrio stylophorae]|nr:FUSC family protein [Vibrio stylophorae]
MSAYTRFALQHSRFLYMIRVTLVMATILFFVRWFHIPYGYWALITAVTILGAIPFVGGVISKANQRIWGTLTGALIGLSLFLIPPQYHWTHHLLFLGLLVGVMYYTQESYSYTALMAAITMVIVAGGGPADMSAAGWRIMNVLWAAVLTIAASLYVFPSRASDQFIHLTAQFLKQSQRYLAHHGKEIHQQTYLTFHATTLSNLIDRQIALLPHAVKEIRPLRSVLIQLLAIEKRFYADLETLVSTHWERQLGKEKICEMAGLNEAQQALSEQFSALATAIEHKQVLAIEINDIELMSLQPHHHVPEQATTPEALDDQSDISYFGYLWLNRELARQFSQLSHACQQLHRYDQANLPLK